MENEIFYISGKITNLPLEDAEKNFFNAQEEIRKRYPGAGYLNPMGIYFGKTGTWDKYLEADLKLLEEYATAIYMLDNWKTSKGANVEKKRAEELGLKVVYQNSNFKAGSYYVDPVKPKRVYRVASINGDVIRLKCISLKDTQLIKSWCFMEHYRKATIKDVARAYWRSIKSWYKFNVRH